MQGKVMTQRQLTDSLKMWQLKYLGFTAQNQNQIQEAETISGNACYHSAPKNLSSRLVSKTLKSEYMKL
jgi:hypothetical protein